MSQNCAKNQKTSFSTFAYLYWGDVNLIWRIKPIEPHFNFVNGVLHLSDIVYLTKNWSHKLKCIPNDECHIASTISKNL